MPQVGDIVAVGDQIGLLVRKDGCATLKTSKVSMYHDGSNKEKIELLQIGPHVGDCYPGEPYIKILGISFYIEDDALYTVKLTSPDLDRHFISRQDYVVSVFDSWIFALERIKIEKGVENNVE